MEVKMVLGKCVRWQREGIFEEKTKTEAQVSNFEFLVEEKDDNGDVISSEKTY